MKRPYKKTELLRATVDRNARCILEPDMSAPDNSYRMVQVLAPSAIFLSFDDPATTGAGGRDFQMMRVPLTVGSLAPFPVFKDQALYAMADFTQGADEASMVQASLIVQHWLVEEGQVQP